jgi:hypothetical protein
VFQAPPFAVIASFSAGSNSTFEADVSSIVPTEALGSTAPTVAVLLADGRVHGKSPGVTTVSLRDPLGPAEATPLASWVVTVAVGPAVDVAGIEARLQGQVELRMAATGQAVAQGMSRHSFTARELPAALASARGGEARIAVDAVLADGSRLPLSPSTGLVAASLDPASVVVGVDGDAFVATLAEAALPNPAASLVLSWRPAGCVVGTVSVATILVTVAAAAAEAPETIDLALVQDAAAATHQLVEAVAVSLAFEGAAASLAFDRWVTSHGGAVVGGAAPPEAVSWTHVLGKRKFLRPSYPQCPSRRQTVVFTAAWGAERVTSSSHFDVVDTSAPRFVTVPASPAVELVSGGAVDRALQRWANSRGGATAVDDGAAADLLEWNATAPRLVSVGTALACKAVHEVTFHVTDSCGNTASMAARFTAEDTIGPALSGFVPTVIAEYGTHWDPESLRQLLYRWLGKPANAKLLVMKPAAQADDGSGVTAWVVPTAATISARVAAAEPPATGSAAVNGGEGGETDASRAPVCRSFAVELPVVARDACGNGAVANISIFVHDSTVPLITRPLQDQTVVRDQSTYMDQLQHWIEQDGGAAATDYSGVVVTSGRPQPWAAATGDDGSCLPLRKVTVPFLFEDGCGNSVTRSAVIAYQAATAPVLFSRPHDVVVEAGNTAALEEYRSWLDRHAGATVAPSATDLRWSPPEVHWVTEVQRGASGTGGDGTAGAASTVGRSCPAWRIAVATFAVKDQCGFTFQYTSKFSIRPACSARVTSAPPAVFSWDFVAILPEAGTAGNPATADPTLATSSTDAAGDSAGAGAAATTSSTTGEDTQVDPTVRAAAAGAGESTTRMREHAWIILTCAIIVLIITATLSILWKRSSTLMLNELLESTQQQHEHEYHYQSANRRPSGFTAARKFSNLQPLSVADTHHSGRRFGHQHGDVAEHGDKRDYTTFDAPTTEETAKVLRKQVLADDTVGQMLDDMDDVTKRINDVKAATGDDGDGGGGGGGDGDGDGEGDGDGSRAGSKLSSTVGRRSSHGGHGNSRVSHLNENGTGGSSKVDWQAQPLAMSPILEWDGSEMGDGRGAAKTKLYPIAVPPEMVPDEQGYSLLNPIPTTAEDEANYDNINGQGQMEHYYVVASAVSVFP